MTREQVILKPWPVGGLVTAVLALIASAVFFYRHDLLLEWLFGTALTIGSISFIAACLRSYSVVSEAGFAESIGGDFVTGSSRSTRLALMPSLLAQGYGIGGPLPQVRFHSLGQTVLGNLLQDKAQTGVGILVANGVVVSGDLLSYFDIGAESRSAVGQV